MDLKSLENKRFADLTAAEKKFIKAKYKAYFDQCDPRLRALGYAVIFGGVPSDKVGLIDISLRPQGWGLGIGAYPILEGNGGEAIAAILDYVRDDPRFAEARQGEGARIPLFVATRNGLNGCNKGNRLHDCKCAIAAAGRAIGFNAVRLKKIYRLGEGLKVCVGGFTWDSKSGMKMPENMPLMRDFPFDKLHY